MLSFPFDSQVTYDEYDIPTYDRAVSSQPLRKLIRDLFTTGVMPNPSNCYQVSAGASGMTVVVQPGYAVIDGGLCYEQETRTLEIQASDNTYDRIDTVVLRWNENVSVRDADLYIIQGVPAQTPVRPELQRDNSIYEIGLADLFITHRSTSITNAKITDTRYESGRCGIVSSVSEWDTTTIYQQVQSDLAEFKSEEEADFAVWYETVKDLIDQVTAASLQNQITALDTRVDAVEDKTGEATTSKAGIMSASDKSKLDGIAQNANNYSLPLADNGTRGGIQIGFQQSGKNYPVQLSNEKAFVNVPWTDTNTSSGITRSATTYVPGTNVEASLQAINKVNTFNVTSASWNATTDYGYAFKMTINTSEYTANSVPVWQMMGTGTITTKAEEVDCEKVKQAYFTASNITLYATEKPDINLVLKVKGV